MSLAIYLNRTKVLNKISRYSRTVAYNILQQFFDSIVRLFLLSGDNQVFNVTFFEEAYFFLCCNGILIKRVTEITFGKYLFIFEKYQAINACLLK